MQQIKDLLKGFGASVGVCLTLLIGIAASPTDSSVRGYLRGLVDSTASPPPLAQATNGTFITSGATTVNGGTVNASVLSNATANIGTANATTANAGTMNASIFSNANATILTGSFTTLLPLSAARTTNTFTNGIGGSLIIVWDALGQMVSCTVN